VFGTGAAARDLAAGLADAGLAVVLIGPDAPAGGPVPTVACALASAAEGDAALAEAARLLGGLDALIWAWTDAEGCRPAPIGALSAEQWARCAEAPLQRMMSFLKVAHARLVGRGGRVVVLVPSLAMTGAAGLVPWASAAEGQRSITKAVARAWGKSGVTVNAVAVPGTLLAGVPADTALDRPGLPPLSLAASPSMRGDVAPVVAGLLGPAFAAVTGTTLGVDGGRWMTP
jgi:NAD(P)-dependent dehydrogenase (short-subunit alcohol dehydrogenase family)